MRGMHFRQAQYEALKAEYGALKTLLDAEQRTRQAAEQLLLQVSQENSVRVDSLLANKIFVSARILHCVSPSCIFFI
eukprot:m.148860 g.148860  ORF g.148860 m.148860 type:complete len:77 (+) comp52754_c0_seq19:457-687(+)